jgi:transcription initiation factor TFIIF subunit beta
MSASVGESVGTIQLGNASSGSAAVGAPLSASVEVDPARLAEGTPQQYSLAAMSSANCARSMTMDDASSTDFVTGTVCNTYTLQPQRDTDYRKFLRARLMSTVTKSRYVKKIDDIPQPGQVAQSMFDTTGTGSGAGPSGKKKRSAADASIGSAGDDDKRLKMDEETLRSLIFRQFEQQDLWTLKDLNAQFKQPDGYLKDVLKKLCSFHRRGEHKNCYELLQVYKK